MSDEFDKNLEPLFNVLNEWLDLDQDTFTAMQGELRQAVDSVITAVIDMNGDDGDYYTGPTYMEYDD